MGTIWSSFTYTPSAPLSTSHIRRDVFFPNLSQPRRQAQPLELANLLLAGAANTVKAHRRAVIAVVNSRSVHVTASARALAVPLQ